MRDESHSPLEILSMESAGFRLNVEADDLARIMGNALAFFPARSPIKTAELRVWPDRLMATGTDTYTLGRDYCPAWNFNSTAPDHATPIRIELDRDGWRAIEAQTRKDKGNPGILEFRPGDCLTYRPGGDKAETVAGKDVTGTADSFLISGDKVRRREVWDLCDDLLERMSEVPEEMPNVMCFDPNLFGRFSKVKLSKEVKADKVLDFIWQGQGQPMLAKVGPTFVGCIMAIDRGSYAENQEDGNESLW